jgi:hypothetical protein
MDHSNRFLRALRPVPDPLGLYVRAGRNDHKELLSILTAGKPIGLGIVFDPTHLNYQRELLRQVLDRRLDAILDPRTQPLATVGGHTPSLGKLPWGSTCPQEVEDFEGIKGRRLIRNIAGFCVENRFTQLLAPTHLIRTLDDGWWITDLKSTEILRTELDRAGGGSVPIIYPLAIPYSLFRDGNVRRELVRLLGSLPVDAVWLGIDGFGSNSTATAVRTVIVGITDFHAIGKPIVGDHIGGMVGSALLAFGAVGGIAHGVTMGEQFDCSSWQRVRPARGFGIPRRVYIQPIDLMLKPSEAEVLFSLGSKARALFGCRDTACCPRSVTDMKDNKVQHFLYQRASEIREIERVPEPLRASQFLERRLRPATDQLVAAAQLPWPDPKLESRVKAKRKRLDGLRVALGNLAQEPRQSVANRPPTRVSRDAPTPMPPSLS